MRRCNASPGWKSFLFGAVLVGLLIGVGAGPLRSRAAHAIPDSGARSAAEPSFKEEDFEKFEHFDPKNFGRSTHIDNEWFPLKPGTRFVYEGFTQEGRKRVPHRVVFTVTDLTKVIDGVRSIVCWDRDYSDGQLIESELVFFAQDDEGSVWHLGQYRETYDETEFVGGRVWVSGLEGARAGIMMKANPQPGTPNYSEGYAPPPYNWTDRAAVVQTGEKTCVPLKCYEDVLVIVEGSKEEGPDAQQLKYYARGVGHVRVGWKGKGDQNKETLELVRVVQLGPEELAKAREEALELEKRAYTYGRTSPAEQALEYAPSAEGQ